MKIDEWVSKELNEFGVNFYDLQPTLREQIENILLTGLEDEFRKRMFSPDLNFAKSKRIKTRNEKSFMTDTESCPPADAMQICVDQFCPDGQCSYSECGNSIGTDCVDSACIHQPDCSLDACLWQDNSVACAYEQRTCMDNPENGCPGQELNTQPYCWDKGTPSQGCIDVGCKNASHCMDGGGTKACKDETCENSAQTSACLDWANCLDLTCRNQSFCHDEKPCIDNEMCQNSRCINVSQCCHDQLCCNTLCMRIGRVQYTDNVACVDTRCDP